MTTLLFDIGANVGLWALANAKIPSTRIVCVEASPSTFHILTRNVYGKNINVLNRALTSEPVEKATFYEVVGGTVSSLNKEWITDPRSRFGETSPHHNKITSEIKVSTTTIDAMITAYGMPDLIKVDVEGAEHIVLKSLTQKANTVCFEWASEWDKETFICMDHMVSLGYTRFHIQYKDDYAYRPAQYELTADDVKDRFKTMTPHAEWGMIWCQ